MQVAHMLATCSLMADRYPQGTGTPRVQALGTGYSIVLTPPCSLLMSANIIYNHVSTGRGDFIFLKV